MTRRSSWSGLLLGLLSCLSALVVLGLYAGERSAAQQATGAIVIEKQTDPDGSTEPFEFAAENTAGVRTAAFFQLQDGETRTFANQPPGLYNVKEFDPGPGYRLTAIRCDDQDSLGDLATRTATIRVAPGETVRCIFENTDVRGTIVIEKQTDPDGATEPFEFAAEHADIAGTRTAGFFQLRDGETRTYSNQPPGLYNIKEFQDASLRLASITCDDGNSTVNLETRTASVRLEARETVRCVFRNGPGSPPPPTGDNGTIVIEKQTDAQGAARSFIFLGAQWPPAFFDLADDETRSLAVPPGTYGVSENDPGPNYALTAIRCDDQDSSGDLATRTATIRVAPGETVRCVFENTDVRGTIVIEKQTDVQGATRNFLFLSPQWPPASFDLADDEMQSFVLPPGAYGVSEVDPGPDYGLAGLICDDANSTGDVATRTATIGVEAKETVRCVFRNALPPRGTIIVRKQTVPAGEPTTFTFSGTAAGTIAHEETIEVGDLEAGTYSSTEATRQGWDLTGISCDDSDSSGNTATRTATFRLVAGETVTCTFTNTERGAVTLLKATNGVVDPSKDITFSLSGFGLPSGGIARSTLGDQDGVLEFGGNQLTPGRTYTICERPVPAGFTSFWKLDGVIVTPYNPDATKTPPEDLGTRCYDFQVTPGQERAFEVDNSRPGGDPRTTGYWKNWNRCTAGNQSATAAKNGGAAAGFFLVEDLLPQFAGDFSVTTCQQAVRLLSKQDQSGKNKAADAAYELGSQFLATRFNLAAGAETCAAVQQAVLDGQSLLDEINFTGSGDYLGSKSKSPRRPQALALAATLDRYNNGNLC
jgi:plastocyanin